MPRKPDRFERVLEKNCSDDDWKATFIPAQCALKLLRKEHQWMVRLIKRYRDAHFPSSLSTLGDALLFELKRRRK